MKRSLLTIGVGLVLGCAGWQLPALGADAAPPGRLVDIGEARLHLHCRGAGSPTVILDAGLGGISLEWTAVQQSLAVHTTVCSYDRPGLGWSDPIGGPRTSAAMVSQLRRLLARARLPGPFLLVGHSFGGYNAQLFASRYPQLTAGLVLVDSSHPEQVERFLAPPIGLNTVPGRRQGMLLMPPPQPPPSAPAELRDSMGSLYLQRKSIVAASRELMGFRDSARQVRAARRALAMPLIVLSRGQRMWDGGAKTKLKERLWQSLQTELVQVSNRSAQLIATASGHHIHLDQPELVADAVRLVAEEAGFGGCGGAAEHCPMSFAAATWKFNNLRGGARFYGSRSRPDLVGSVAIVSL